MKTKDILLWGGLAAAAYYLFTQSGSTASAASMPLSTSGSYGAVTLPNGQSVTLPNSQVSMASGSMTALINGVNYALQVQSDGSTLAVPVAGS